MHLFQIVIKQEAYIAVIIMGTSTGIQSYQVVDMKKYVIRFT